MSLQDLERKTAAINARAEKLEATLKTSQENLLHAQAVNEFKTLGLPERQADLFLADGNTDITAKSVDRFLTETGVSPKDEEVDGRLSEPGPEDTFSPITYTV